VTGPPVITRGGSPLAPVPVSRNADGSPAYVLVISPARRSSALEGPRSTFIGPEPSEAMVNVPAVKSAVMLPPVPRWSTAASPRPSSPVTR